MHTHASAPPVTVTHPVPLLLQAYKTYQLGGKLNELLYSPALYGVDLSGKVR
jgi:hypothetical protein